VKRATNDNQIDRTIALWQPCFELELSHEGARQIAFTTSFPGTSAGLERALTLVRSGLPCFPCRSDKRPTTPRGFKDATRDSDLLRELWKHHPGPLIGIPTGEVSGFDVLDIDPRHGGNSWFAEHKLRLPPTRVHRTRSGGLHLFFQYESGLRCSAGRIAAGVDVRAAGGYIIWWPGARLPVLSRSPVAPWPKWLHDHVLPPPRSTTARAIVPDGHALMHLVRLIASAREGERNNLTYWAACRAGEMVASGLLGANTAVAVIVEAAMRAGLSRAEAERAACNGVNATGGTSHA
jgi:hypothetical protein